jgi:predicted DNA-binding transcriptional regulator AlpA
MTADPPRFYRLPQIIGNPKATPPIEPLIPISKSAWWDGIAKGRFPAGIKIGSRMTVWRAEDIHALIQNAK